MPKWLLPFGEAAFAAGALEDALRQRDARRDPVLVHVLDGHLRILFDVIADVLFVILSENRNHGHE